MIPKIMVIQGNVEDLNISLDENTVIIHALDDITISLCGGEFPSGTLRFKTNQVIMLPLLEE